MAHAITNTVAVSPSAEDEFLASSTVMHALDQMTLPVTDHDLDALFTPDPPRSAYEELTEALAELRPTRKNPDKPRSQKRNAKRNRGEVIFDRQVKKEIFYNRLFRRMLIQDLKDRLAEPVQSDKPASTIPWWLIDESDTDYEDYYEPWHYLPDGIGGHVDDSCMHDDDYPESAYEDEYVSLPGVRDYEYWFDSPEEELRKHYPTHTSTEPTNQGTCRGCDLEAEIAMANSYCQVCRSYSCRSRTLHFGDEEYYANEDREVFNRLNALPLSFPHRSYKPLGHLLNNKEVAHYADDHDCVREGCYDYDPEDYIEPDSPCTRMDDVPDNDEPYCQYCRSYRCKHLTEDDPDIGFDPDNGRPDGDLGWATIDCSNCGEDKSDHDSKGRCADQKGFFRKKTTHEIHITRNPVMRKVVSA